MNFVRNDNIENIENAEQVSEKVERLVKQEEIIEKLQEKIEYLEKQNLYLQESFNVISNSFFWKITKPARLTLDISKWLLQSHDNKNLFYKGIKSIWKNGLHETWKKVIQIVYYSNNNST